MKPLLALCLTFCIVNFGLSQKRIASEARGVSELRRLEKVWNQAQLSLDDAALAHLWADDLVVTVPNMPVMDKLESLEFVRSAKLRFQTYKTSDLRIRVYGDAAVVTGQLERTRTSTGGAFEDDWRFTKVYVRRGRKWKVVAWHGSPVGH